MPSHVSYFYRYLSILQRQIIDSLEQTKTFSFSHLLGTENWKIKWNNSKSVMQITEWLSGYGVISSFWTLQLLLTAAEQNHLYAHPRAWQN